MIETYRRLKRRRAAGEIDEGFTLIELLIVIVVLGILAAIVVFALGGVTGKSLKAACQADAKTVSTAVGAFQAENPTSDPASTGAWKTDLLTNDTGTFPGAPFLQSWPTGGGTGTNQAYAVEVAAGNTTTTAYGSMPTGTAPKFHVLVIVKSGPGQGTFDATKYPVAACSGLS
jgi:prepilin-type N-terminal cleavage/methylation domain-containing protein